MDAHWRAGSIARVAIPTLLVLILDLAIGWLNFHATDDVQPVAAVLILGGFGFALWRPRRSWLGVLLLWLAVPLSSLLTDAYNYHPGVVKPAPLYETLVALIPTAIGAVPGAVLGALRQRRGGGGA